MEEININKLHTGDPENMEAGNTILLRASYDKKGEDMFLTFGAIVVKSDVVSSFNKHRKRDYVPKLRRAWIPTTMDDIKDNMSIDLLDLEVAGIDNKGREYYELNVLNPVAYAPEYNRIMGLSLQISETVEPTPEQLADWQNKAKKINGEYFKHQGKLIFSNTSIVRGKPAHVFLQHDPPEYVIMDNKTIVEEPELMDDTEMEGSFLD